MNHVTSKNKFSKGHLILKPGFHEPNKVLVGLARFGKKGTAVKIITDLLFLNKSTHEC